MHHVVMSPGIAALTVAGSDSGGGAGIQADLKTFSALGVFGASVITAITAQNLSGVSAIQPIAPDTVTAQLKAVLEGFPIGAVKTGMLFSGEIIAAICNVLELPQYRRIPVIVDPVFAATSGGRLIRDEAIDILKERLFPLASLITPNIPEAEFLADETIHNEQDLEKTGVTLWKRFGVPVLMKGGHLPERAADLLVDENGTAPFVSEWVEGVNNHGSGCTFSAAVAAGMAGGLPLREAVTRAKRYISESLRNALPLNPHLRVINHFPGI